MREEEEQEGVQEGGEKKAMGRRTHATDDKGRHEPAAAADHAPEVECGCGDEEEAEDDGAGFAGAVGVEGMAAAAHFFSLSFPLVVWVWGGGCSLAIRRPVCG